MLRLVKHLKPYIVLIIIAIGLLFVQANCDLALPDYMSDIVNTGIQQGGVESAVPVAIRQSEMNRVTIFMSADNKDAVLADYTLENKDSSNYATYVKIYPDLANEPFTFSIISAHAEKDKLNPIMGKALLAVTAIEQAAGQPGAGRSHGPEIGCRPVSNPTRHGCFHSVGQASCHRHCANELAVRAEV